MLALRTDGTFVESTSKAVQCPICKGEGVLTVQGLLLSGAGQRCEMCRCEGSFPAHEGNLTVTALISRRISQINSTIACHLDLIDSRVRPDGKDWETRQAIHDMLILEADFLERLRAFAVGKA